MHVDVEIPTRLPVAHLSVSSMRTWLQCQVRWDRRYNRGEFEPARPPMLAGTAVHRAEGASYQSVISGQRLHSTDQVVDEFSSEFDVAVEQSPEVDWEGEKPGRVKDTGVRVVKTYHRIVAPTVRPLTVEREYVIKLDGVEWVFKGYLDLEEDVGGGAIGIADYKVRKRSTGLISEADAATDLQVTGNLWAGRAEERAKRFAFHNLVRPEKRGDVLTPKHVAVTPAVRSQGELDAFGDLLVRVATSIHTAVSTDTYLPAPPGAWWCAERTCGFWRSCAFGGDRRLPISPGPPRPARRLSDTDVIAAVMRTRTKREGQTTAAKVAVDLGITVHEASGRLRSLERQRVLVGSAPTKATGRGKARVVEVIPGARRYQLPTQEAMKA